MKKYVAIGCVLGALWLGITVSEIYVGVTAARTVAVVGGIIALFVALAIARRK